ncbi:MAG: methyltransferase domain-containing protein [Chloroflexota bacterium]
MTETNPLSLAETWDLVAEGFDRSVWDLFSQFGLRALDIVDPQPNARVLDVACGAGSLTIPAAHRVTEVTAVDFSPQMVAATRRRVAADRLENVSVHLGDCQELMFKDDSFDAAFSLFGLMFFSSRDQGLREMGRLLRPGALAVISSWPPMSTSPAMASMVEALAEASGTPMPDLEVPGQLGTEADIRCEVEAAGLEIIEVERFDGRLEAQTFEAVWGIAHDANAHLQLAKKQLGPEFHKIVDKLATGLRRRLGEPPYKLILPAFLTIIRAP